MKSTEIVSRPALVRGPDRLTQILIFLACCLVAAVVAVFADLMMEPESRAPVVQAQGVVPAAIPPSPVLPSPMLSTVVSSLVGTVEQPSPVPITPPPCVPPDDWAIHVVQEGNTLYSLARRYGTDIDTLMSVNCLNTHTIFIGQHLYVPGPPITPTRPVPIAAFTPLPEPTSRPGASATPGIQTFGTPGAPPSTTPAAPLRSSVPDHFLNIVLLGSDKRPNSGAWRTDSMIIVSVDTLDNSIRLLSLPRDLWVNIPGHGYNRINTADLWGELAKKGGGAERVKQTIYQNLGIPIHYYVRVDFNGFIKIIDAVGGVDIDVECPLPDINLSAGMHHLDGKHALRYARSRKSTNDFDRGRRQRKVLMALWQQALTLDIVPRLPELWITMADTFKTDLPLEQVINLAYLGTRLKPQQIRSKAIDASMTQSWVTPEGAAVLLPREDRIRAMIKSFYAPLDTTQVPKSTSARIEVLNGSRRRDAEQLAAAALRWEGVKVAAAKAADRQDYTRTTILVYNGDTAAGEQIARVLGVSVTAVEQRTNPNPPADIQVILGPDYNPCRR